MSFIGKIGIFKGQQVGGRSTSLIKPHTGSEYNPLNLKTKINH